MHSPIWLGAQECGYSNFKLPISSFIFHFKAEMRQAERPHHTTPTTNTHLVRDHRQLNLAAPCTLVQAPRPKFLNRLTRLESSVRRVV